MYLEQGKGIEIKHLTKDRAIISLSDAGGSSGATSNQNKRAISVVFDGGGSAITTGSQVDVCVPYSGTITGWQIVNSGGGATTAVLDVWKDTYANWPPTVADTIAGTEKPTLTVFSAKAEDLTLTTWTTTVTAGDWLRINVDSGTSTKVTLVIFITASA